MKVTIKFSEFSRTFFVENEGVLNWIKSNVSNDQLIIEEGEGYPLHNAAYGGTLHRIHSEFDVAYLERQLFTNDIKVVAYDIPGCHRVIKHLKAVPLEGEDVEGLLELAHSPSFRIALSAQKALYPNLPVYEINGVYFTHLTKDYWSIVGGQTTWMESDEIK